MTEQTENGTTTPATEAPLAAVTQPDELVTLRSRNAGLDSKVSTLLQQIADERTQREAAQARLSEYEAGKAGANEAAAAQIERLNAELAARDKALKVSDLRGKYPETFNVYGEAIAGMSEDVLAAGETRLKGVAVEVENPIPVGINAPRTPAPQSKSIEEMTAAELREHGKSAFVGLTWEAISQGD
jgi:hypothetical protein